MAMFDKTMWTALTASQHLHLQYLQILHVNTKPITWWVVIFECMVMYILCTSVNSIHCILYPLMCRYRSFAGQKIKICRAFNARDECIYIWSNLCAYSSLFIVWTWNGTLVHCGRKHIKVFVCWVLIVCNVWWSLTALTCKMCSGLWLCVNV